MADRAPALSVVVCTHNRAHHLRQALESLTTQRHPREDFEVLVVDNRSTDDTRAVAESFSARLPLRYVHEPALGLCEARNTGWRDAAGRFVAYFDDDATADPGWLGAVRAAFDRAPHAGVVGGRVLPRWEGERPGWLSDDLVLGLTVVDWPGGFHEIADLNAEWVVGANMAAPRAVLAEVGGFHPWLDRVGDKMLSSGDVFFARQVVQRGHACVYAPDALVHHLVPAGRLTKEWFRNRYYWQGVSDAVMELIEGRPSVARRVVRAARRAGRLLASPRRWPPLLRTRPDAASFTEECWSWIAIGQVAGLLGAGGR